MKDIPWVEIIREAAKSPEGLIALSVICVSILAYVLFGRDNKNTNIKLIAFVFAIFGIALFIYPVWNEYKVEAKSQQDALRLQALIGYCRHQMRDLTTSCRAYDKSGIHSSPSASCSMRLDAGTGRFFAENTVTVVSESYRNISGVAAKDAMKPIYAEHSGEQLIIAFAGSIGCTNAQGTGRTCESNATVNANSYPFECAAVRKELRG
jgi:hypothetical protein